MRDISGNIHDSHRWLAETRIMTPVAFPKPDVFTLDDEQVKRAPSWLSMTGKLNSEPFRSLPRGACQLQSVRIFPVSKEQWMASLQFCHYVDKSDLGSMRACNTDGRWIKRYCVYQLYEYTDFAVFGLDMERWPEE